MHFSAWQYISGVLGRIFEGRDGQLCLPSVVQKVICEVADNQSPDVLLVTRVASQRSPRVLASSALINR